MRDIHETDPEFMERFEHFAFDEVVNEPGQELEPETRYLAILATLLGCQGIDEFRTVLPRALDAGISPVMAKEVIYQAVDYLGIGRVRPFLDAANEILEARGVSPVSYTHLDVYKRQCRAFKPRLRGPGHFSRCVLPAAEGRAHRSCRRQWRGKVHIYEHYHRKTPAR